MAELSGTNLASSIVPFTTEDTFATHLAKFGKGGWRSVADTAERDGITADRREAGMAVYVISEKKVYTLESDLVTWTELKTGPEEITVEHDDTLQGEGTEESPLGLSDTVKSDIAGKADKADTLAGYGITDAYTKTETDAKLSAVYHAKGSVADYDSLPESASVGDVYNLLDTGANYVWTESGWDKLSENVDLSGLATKDDLSGKADKTDIPTQVSQLENDSGYITQASLEGLGLPDQTGNNGKFLMTNGSETSWEKALKNNATGENYLAVGNNARTYEYEYGSAVAIGTYTRAENNSVAVGGYAEAQVAGGLAIGNNAKANSFDATTNEDHNGIAVGTDAKSTNAQAISIGGESQSSGVKSIAIGSSAVAGADGAIQLGEGTNNTADTLQFKDKTIIKGDGTVPYERLSTATPTAGQVLKYDGDSDSLVWGAGGGGSAEYPDQTDNAGKFLMTDGTDVSWESAIRNNSENTNALAIGHNATANGENAVVIGTNAKSNSSQGANVVIGKGAVITGSCINSTAIGIDARADNYDATAIGRNAIAGAQYSFAAGYSAKTDPVYCDYNIDDSQPVVAVGTAAVSRSNSTIAIGRNVYADGPFSIVIGQNSNVGNGKEYGIAIGKETQVVGSEGIAVGNTANSARDGIALGTRAKVKQFGGVAIGLNTDSDGVNAVTIGNQSYARGGSSVALGGSAIVDYDAIFAVQLGIGTNYDAYTLQFRDYTVIQQDGTIPYGRLSVDPPEDGFALVYDGQEDRLRWSKVGSGDETAGTEVIIRRWN